MSERNKGKRIVDLISDYVVIDLETTSNNVNYAEIIEIGALKVVNNQVVSSYSTLVKPDFDIPYSATAVNGITNEMVSDAPTIREVLGEFLDFVGDNVIVGHNITTFDVNIIYDYTKALFNEDFMNSYFDTLYMSRKCMPFLENHKLSTISEYYNLNLEGEHRALADCYLTQECYQRMKTLCVNEHIDLHESERRRRSPHNNYSEETKSLQLLQGYLLGITSDGVLTNDEIIELKRWMDENRNLEGNYPFDVVMKSLEHVLEDGIIDSNELNYLLALYKKFTAPVENSEHDEINSLEGLHCCITGEFNYGDRKSVEQYIVTHGGICDSNVKRATNYVIVGSCGSDAWKHGNYGSKIKKAIELKEKGNDINIISEEAFFKEVEGE